MTTRSVLHFRDVGIGDVADRRRQGRQPRRAAAGGHPRAHRLRGDDGGLPADRRAPHRPRRAGPARVAALDPADADGLAAVTAEIRDGPGVRAAARRGRRGGHRGVRGAVRGVRRPRPAGRRPVERDQRGQRRGQLRRAAGHLPVGARGRLGARARPPLLGEPLQRRVGDLPAASRHPGDRPGDGRRRPADGRRPQLGRDVHPQPADRRPVGGRHRRQLGPRLRRRQRRRHPRLVRGQQGDRRDQAERGHQDPLAPARPVRLRRGRDRRAGRAAGPSLDLRRRRSPNWSRSPGRSRRTTAARRTSSGRSDDRGGETSSCCRAGRRRCGRTRTATAKAAPAARPFDHVFNLLGGKRPSEG